MEAPIGRGVIVVGAGGHALVSIEVLRSAGRDVAGCVTSDGTAPGDLAGLGVAVLGAADGLAELVAAGHGDVFVAVAPNRARQEVVGRAVDAGARLVSAISPHALVSPSAAVAPGALVMPGAVVNARARIDTAAIVNTRASVDHECHIGSFAHVGPGATLAGGITVGAGALVGVGACVTPGRTIGAWSTVGAGSAVVRDVPPGATVAGVPARTTYGSGAVR